MAAVLDDAAFLQHHDLIRHAHRGEAVRDDDGDAVARQFPKMLEHLGFRGGIDGGGGLVEHQNVRFAAHEGARQGDLLPLAAGQFATVLEPLAELGAVSRGQRLDEFGRKPLHRGAAPARLVVERPHVARADVLSDEHLIAGEILEDHADALAQGGLVPLPQIQAIQQDTALRRLIKDG